MKNKSADIQISDVSINLGTSEILHSVSACIPAGCMVGLVGPNGAGKSTLLRSLAGLLPLRKGRITLGSADIRTLSRREIARRVCLLPQNAAVAFPFTVIEAVSMGRNPHLGRFDAFSEQDDEIVAHAMRRTGVDKLARRSVTELSGGELQRVLLARSLATEAPVLLLDEPTASLDILHQLEVLDLLQRFTETGKTVVVSMHDLRLARRSCSRILLIDRGNLVAEGTADKTLCPENVETVFGVRVLRGESRSMSFELPEKKANPRQ